MNNSTNKFYLVGIKGTGMASLARLLKASGYEVVGSDTTEYYFTESALIKENIPIFKFNKKNIVDDAFYIIGSAYDINNIEVEQIIENDYPFLYYNDFIGEKVNKKIIACAGTHGKTTTSYFLTNFLNKECSYIIGDGSGGYFDNDLLVLEACEYKNHFLSYHPELTIITNIELDHTDYFKSKKQLLKSFQALVNNSKTILVNGDDRLANKLFHKNKLTYGFKEHNDIKIKILSTTYNSYYVQVKYKDNIYIKVPHLGKHMIYNYVSAYIATLLLGYIPKNLDSKDLPKRRLTKIKYKDSILIDDYAHHPTEIKALINSLRLSYPDKDINIIFQPHTYERTLKFKKKFKKALKLATSVYMMDVFTSKREKNNQSLQNKIDRYFKRFMKIDKLDFNKIGLKEDVWVFLGAGVANKYIRKLIKNNNQ